MYDDRLKVKKLLLGQMSAVESGRSSLPSLTLDAILRMDKRTPPLPPPPPPVRSSSNRTLLDIMQEEHREGHSRDKAAWKTFMDKLRPKRSTAGSETSSSNPDISSEATAISNHDDHSQRSIRLEVLLYNSAESRTHEAIQTELTENNNLAVPANHPSVTSISPEREEEPVAREGRMRLGAVLAEERTLSDREAESATRSTDEEGQTARISLMELLEETDRQVRFVGAPRYALDDLLKATTTTACGEDEAEKYGGCSDKAGPVNAAEELSCCVCMVRNKGAAFIPCGHTFCRLCSRELWVQRGSCPLCNTSILEILDIF